jgi:hypothetical protein
VPTLLWALLFAFIFWELDRNSTVANFATAESSNAFLLTHS